MAPTRRQTLGFLALGVAPLARSSYFRPVFVPAGSPVSRIDQEEMGAILAGLRANLLSVTDFGASGAGTTSDTRAINRAIRALSPGQTLYFPNGIYLIDNTDLQTVRGIGTLSTAPLPAGTNVLMEDGAWLKRAPSHRVSGPYFLTALGENILRVNIDGDQYPASGGMAGAWRGGDGVGIFAANASDVTITNSRFRNLTFGIEARGLARWRIADSFFDRMKLSGCLLRGSDQTPAVQNRVYRCAFEEMGDTAVAFHYMTGSSVVAHNLVEDCVAKNTQMRVDGYAFDVEGAPGQGTHYDNAFRNLTVEQVSVSGRVQGGLTINANSANSSIIGCRITGNAAPGSIGISVLQTSGMELTDNQIDNFRANAIFADGARSPHIARNKIRDCGDGSAPEFSTILLSLAEGSHGALVEGNEIVCSASYPHLGPNGAAILARRYSLNIVDSLTVRENIITNPVGHGISIYGYSPLTAIGQVSVENNQISTQTLQPAGVRAIQVRYARTVRMRGNRVRSPLPDADLTGSTDIVTENNVSERIPG